MRRHRLPRSLPPARNRFSTSATSRHAHVLRALFFRPKTSQLVNYSVQQIFCHMNSHTANSSFTQLRTTRAQLSPLRRMSSSPRSQLDYASETETASAVTAIRRGSDRLHRTFNMPRLDRWTPNLLDRLQSPLTRHR